MRTKTTIAILTAILPFVAICTLEAQSADVSRMKAQYDAGNRSSAFLRDYSSELIADNPDGNAAAVFVEYMMSLPRGKRYTSENVQTLSTLPFDAGSELLADIVKNWKKIGRTDSAAQLAERINTQVIDITLRAVMYRGVAGYEIAPPDFSAILKQARKSGFAACIAFDWMELWEAAKIPDTDKMVTSALKILGDTSYFTDKSWSLMGYYLNSVLLENTDMEQTRAIYNTLKNLPRTGGRRMPLRESMENFEGKLMLMEMGLE